MPPKKRKSYSIEFKIKALLKLAENKNNITKTAKDIGVHRKQVRKKGRSLNHHHSFNSFMKLIDRYYL